MEWQDYLGLAPTAVLVPALRFIFGLHGRVIVLETQAKTSDLRLERMEDKIDRIMEATVGRR